MTEQTHNIRVSQAMTSRVANTSTKIVEASGTKMMEVVVGLTKDISGSLIEWGSTWMNK
jgi:hypothetical protein